MEQALAGKQSFQQEDAIALATYKRIETNINILHLLSQLASLCGGNKPSGFHSQRFIGGRRGYIVRRTQ